MPKKKKKSKGFTLIELLVVIAIIGILSGIVLVSVNQARNSAKDAAIKGSMETLRAAAELRYDTDGHYGAVCTAAGGAVSTLSSSGDFGRIASAVALQSGVTTGPGCMASPSLTSATYYVSWSPLIKDSTKFFCVDSSGAAKVVGAAPAAQATVCP